MYIYTIVVKLSVPQAPNVSGNHLQSCIVYWLSMLVVYN